MIKLSKKFVTAIATGAVLANALTPLAFADTQISISGNGAFSGSTANVGQTNTTSVVQTNTANVTNNVTSNANTGKNDASFNTGGDTTIKTGNAGSDVSVSNDLNKNVADVKNCNCDGDLKVAITGNGAFSGNEANVGQTNTTSVFQTNTANVDNNIHAKSNSGDNSGSFNTGGDTTIVTGNAQTGVDLSTKANTNWAKVGDGNGSNGGSVQAIISGNGAYSSNDLNLGLTNSVALVQTNVADVDNTVYAKANTGKNTENFNTGGDNVIKTGNAKTWVGVDNDVNFNAADVDCGCLQDIKAVVDGNGAYSGNDLNAGFTNALEAFQTSVDNTDNTIHAKSDSGKNSLGFSTGDTYADPFVWTGDATSNQSVENSGNTNVFGPSADVTIPGGFHLNFSFDLSDLLSLLHIA